MIDQILKNMAEILMDRHKARVYDILQQMFKVSADCHGASGTLSVTVNNLEEEDVNTLNELGFYLHRIVTHEKVFPSYVKNTYIVSWDIK